MLDTTYVQRSCLLSARLEAVLALLAPCGVLVDVGTDHALIPIAAVQRGIAGRAIASDLRILPLASARGRIANLRSRAEPRASTLRSRAEPRASTSTVAERVALVRQDGLSALARDAVDAVSMAGLSGELMVQLLDAAPHVLEGVSQLLAQPNSDAVAVRRWALRNGFHLRHERMVQENGQFFVVCAFCKGHGADPAYTVSGFRESDLCLVGPKLLVQKQPVAREFCAWQCQRLGALVERGVHGRRPELQIWQAAGAFMAGSA